MLMIYRFIFNILNHLEFILPDPYLPEPSLYASPPPAEGYLKEKLYDLFFLKLRTL